MILQQYYFSINNISKNQSSSIKMLPTDTKSSRQNDKKKKEKHLQTRMQLSKINFL